MDTRHSYNVPRFFTRSSSVSSPSDFTVAGAHAVSVQTEAMARLLERLPPSMSTPATPSLEQRMLRHPLSARDIERRGVRLEPWHHDIFSYLRMLHQRSDASSEQVSISIPVHVVVPQIFVDRAKRDAMWSLFSPDDVRDLADAHTDDAFARVYCAYEASHHVKAKVKAKDIWDAIVACQRVAGVPAVFYKYNSVHS